MLAPCVAEIVKDVVVVTDFVDIPNVVELAPPGMRTEVGTVTPDPFTESATLIPPAPAGPFKVTIPVAEFPPTTGFGDTATLIRAGGLIVSVAVCEFAP